MPIHTVYVGGHAFDAETPRRLAEGAREFFAGVFSDAEGLPDLLDLDPDLAAAVHRRVAARLASNEISDVIEDLRVDFEDGYAGDDVERDARRAAEAAVTARETGELPEGFGVRIPSMAPSTAHRAERILDLFVPHLGGGDEAAGVVVTLAMVRSPAEVARLARLLDEREPRWGLEAGTVGIELMAETPRSIYDAEGRLALPRLVAAAGGRCRGVHFGIYDYTASLGLVAGQQRLRHPACDHARSTLQTGLAGLDPKLGAVELSDGSSRVVPRLGADGEVPADAVRGVYRDVRHGLDHGIWRGWDMAASHVAIRRVAVTAFFLEHLPEATRRWTESAGGARAAGDDLEDAATRTALRSFFRRGVECGVLETGEIP